MKVKVNNILKQNDMVKHALEKTEIKKLIQLQMKMLSVIVEYYYKYNMFIIV